MGLPRRSDIIDRGRRWVPQNGDFGAITIRNEQSFMVPGFTWGDSFTGNYELKATDTANGETWTVNTYITNPTFNWSSNQGGTVSVRFPAPLVNFVCRAQNVKSVTMTKVSKWTDLAQIRLDANNLEAVTTGVWPSLNTLCLYTNAPLLQVKTFDWPNLKYCYISNTGITSFETKEWPELLNFDLNGCINLAGTINTYDWPKLETLNTKGATSLENFDLSHEWPNMTLLDLAYNAIEDADTFTTNNGWVSLTSFNCYNMTATVNTLETHSEWVNLEQFVWTHANTVNMTLHPEWVNCDFLYLRNNNFSAGKPTISSGFPLSYVNLVSCSMNATEIDEALIEVDACGTSNGIMYTTLNPGSGASNRSPTANTAIANLIGRGWTVTY